jgi:hypothetical protein
MTRSLAIWVVYDHPKDYPDGYVARRFENDKPTASFVASKNLAVLQSTMIEMGLVRLMRSPEDGRVILETWL